MPATVTPLPKRVAHKVPAHVMNSLETYKFQIVGNDCCTRIWQRLTRIVDEHCADIDREIDRLIQEGANSADLISKYTNYAADLFHMALGRFQHAIWEGEAIDLQRQVIPCGLAEIHFSKFDDFLKAAKISIVKDWRQEPKSEAARRRRGKRDLPYGLDRLFSWGL
jgi:hypothetical protein